MTVFADDTDRIMAVMEAAFDPAFGEAWTRRQIEDALLLGTCHYGLMGADGQIAEPGAQVAGFSLSRTAYDEEELLLFAIVPQFRRQGLGGKLLSHFMEQARQRGMCRVLLEMRAGNSAEKLYRRAGFLPIGHRPNYYRCPDSSRIDAITFACSFN